MQIALSSASRAARPVVAAAASAAATAATAAAFHPAAAADAGPVPRLILTSPPQQFPGLRSDHIPASHSSAPNLWLDDDPDDGWSLLDHRQDGSYTLRQVPSQDEVAAAMAEVVSWNREGRSYSLGSHSSSVASSSSLHPDPRAPPPDSTLPPHTHRPTIPHPAGGSSGSLCDATPFGPASPPFPLNRSEGPEIDPMTMRAATEGGLVLVGGGQGRAFVEQALSLMENDVETMATVESLVMDPTVWNAFMDNPAMQGLMRRQSGGVAPPSGNPGAGEDEQASHSRRAPSASNRRPPPHRSGPNFFARVLRLLSQIGGVLWDQLRAIFDFAAHTFTSPVTDDAQKRTILSVFAAVLVMVAVVLLKRAR